MSKPGISRPSMAQPDVKTRMPEAALAELSGWIASEFGLHYPRERWPHLEREISAAAVDAGFCAGLLEYLDKLLSRNIDPGSAEGGNRHERRAEIKKNLECGLRFRT